MGPSEVGPSVAKPNGMKKPAAPLKVRSLDADKLEKMAGGWRPALGIWFSHCVRDWLASNQYCPVCGGDSSMH